MFVALTLYITAALDPKVILEKADAFRSPKGGFEAKVEVTEPSGDVSAYTIYMEGNDRSLMVTQKPERDIGRNILMIDRDMFMFLPKVNRPVRIALRQKLVGQVSQGDISRMKWVGDYEATLDSMSTYLDGIPALTLHLKASKRDLTYDLIDLTISAKDYRPLSASYLTPNRKLLKSASFQDYGPLAGATRPRKIVIQDAITSKDTSTIKIKEMKERKFPAGFFTEANLAKPQLK